MDLTGQESSIAEELRHCFSGRLSRRSLGACSWLTVSTTPWCGAVDLCVVTVEACEFAGALLSRTTRVAARVRSDPIIDELDELQLRTGEGPCVDAIATQLPFYADELGHRRRAGPSLGPALPRSGCASFLALPMVANGTTGAVNL